MTKTSKIALVGLRVALGWLFFYAGITKLLNPDWSAAGFLANAKTFSGFFQWFASPEILPITNFLNEWGLTLIGASLILGIFVRVSSIFGVMLMALYYLPILTFPYAGTSSFVVDQHIIFILVLILLASLRAGRYYGLENWCSGLPICSKFPKIRSWIG